MDANLSKRSAFLVMFDVAAVPFAFLLSSYVTHGKLDQNFLSQPAFFLAVPVYLISFYIFDFYYAFKRFEIGRTFIECCYSIGLGSVLLFAYSYLDRTFLLQRPVFAVAAFYLGIFVFVIRLIYDFVFRTQFSDKRALIIGTGSLAKDMYRVVKKTPYSRINVIGFVASEEDEEEETVGAEVDGVPVVGSLSRVLSLIGLHNVDLLIFALEHEHQASESEMMRSLLGQNVVITSAIHLFERLDQAVPFHYLSEHYILGLMAKVRTLSYLKVKRMVDIIFALSLILVFSPLMLLTMLILCFDGPSRIIYTQKRIGKNAKPFSVYKFRSMTDVADGKQKITRYGKFIRKFRIDETPQLFNILKGDMTLVGPRPEIPYFVEKCRNKIPFYDAVFTLRPGLTGWAQVQFLHVTELKDYPRKFQYNLYYLKNISFTLDLVIVFKTVRIVLLGKGK